MGKQIVAAAVDRLLGDDVVALLRQGLDDIGYRRCAGGKRQRAHAALQSGKALFQHVLGGVGEPAVDISGVCKIETGRRMCGVVEHVGGRLVDRDGPRVGGGIGLLLAHMELQRFEFIVRHDMYLFFLSYFRFYYPIKAPRNRFDRERRNKVIGHRSRTHAAP